MDGARKNLYFSRMVTTGVSSTSPAWRFELVSMPESVHPHDEGFSGQPQWSTDLHLIHTIKGSGVLRAGRRVIETRPDNVIVVPIHTHCTWRKPAGAPWRMINLHVRIRDETGLAVHASDPLPSSFSPADMGGVHQRLSFIARQWARGEAQLRAAAAAGALSLVAGYLADFGRDWRAQARLPDQRVRDMTAYLQEAARMPYDPETLSDVAGLGISQCNRVFRAAMGVSPKAYWMQHRLGLAQAMLAESAAPIQRTADALGFSDIYYFSRWFKAGSGLTPSAFRRQYRQF